MENPTNEENFDYFNSDIYLLTLNILLEGFYRGQGVFTLDQFLKGNYWKIEEIADEIKDTNDFGSVEDMVLHQVFSNVKFHTVPITLASLLGQEISNQKQEQDTKLKLILSF